MIHPPLRDTQRRLVRLVGLALLGASLAGADWPRFRGPDGSGTSAETGLPTEWSETAGLAWKTPIPGPGSSSPVISAGRVFLTCYSGYGVGRGGGGSQEQLRRHVVCVDAKSGKLLWDRSIESKLPEVAYQGIGVPNHGYASATPAADGERVYAFFGRSGVVAYDYEGKELWRAAVTADPRTHNFGTASSPVVAHDLVIVPASIECEEIVAFDRKTGKEAWRTPASGYGGWWGTPIPNGTGDSLELVFAVPGELWGLNPKNGKLRWYASTFGGRAMCPSPVAAGGVAYIIGERDSQAAAVKLGGKGDMTKTNLVWTQRTGAYVPSPVVLDGHVYWVTDRGIAYCVKADTGAEVYQKRLDNAGSVYSSLLAADGKLYCVTRRNGTFVLDAKPEFKVLAHNKLAGDDTDFNASLAVSDGKLYLRSDRFLYCVGKTP